MGKANHPIYGRPGHLIRRLHQIAVAIFMSETKDFNITPVQYSQSSAVDLRIMSAWHTGGRSTHIVLAGRKVDRCVATENFGDNRFEIIAGRRKREAEPRSHSHHPRRQLAAAR